MVKQPFLSRTQKLFLQVLSGSKQLCKQFYLTGGTALTAFYLPHRVSEDLDFFSEKEVEIGSVLVWLRSIKAVLGYGKFDLNTSFNRHIVQLFFTKEVLKLKFTYFPFPQIEKPLSSKGLKVDSVLDIAVNKLFTIYQNPRSRDFMDLYMIVQKYGFLPKDLVKKAKIKFDWHVDPIKLGSQYLKARELKDYPKLMVKLNPIQWQGLFLKEAKKLETKIFTA